MASALRYCVAAKRAGNGDLGNRRNINLYFRSRLGRFRGQKILNQLTLRAARCTGWRQQVYRAAIGGRLGNGSGLLESIRFRRGRRRLGIGGGLRFRIINQNPGIGSGHRRWRQGRWLIDAHSPGSQA